MDIEQMTPRRPYLLRAHYEWLVDNDLTPHLVVDATMNGVRVPEEFIQDGQIILNVAPRAVGQLELSNEAVTFNARFGGRPHSVIVPLYAVQAIYARENGSGTMFEPEEAYLLDNLDDDLTPDEPMKAKPSLSVAQHNSDPDTSSVEASDSNPSGSDDPDNDPPKAKGKPSLRVIK